MGLAYATAALVGENQRPTTCCLEPCALPRHEPHGTQCPRRMFARGGGCSEGERGSRGSRAKPPPQSLSRRKRKRTVTGKFGSHRGTEMKPIIVVVVVVARCRGEDASETTSRPSRSSYREVGSRGTGALRWVAR